MSDRRKEPAPDFSDVDWDAALDEWEKFALSDPPPKKDTPAASGNAAPEFDEEATVSRTKSNEPTSIISTEALPPIPKGPSPRLELEEESTHVYDREAIEKAAAAPTASIPRAEDSAPIPPPILDDEDASALAPRLEVLMEDSDILDDIGETTAGAIEAWNDERAASGWLDDAALEDFSERASWFEQEAELTKDPSDRARLYLAASELRAITGDADHARTLAELAKTTDQRLFLARVQHRQLSTRDPLTVATLLDEEAAAAVTPAVRLHSLLFSAELHRLSGDGERARERWRNAVTIDPNDARAHISLVGLALAFGDYNTPDVALPASPPFAALSRALNAVLTLRGAGKGPLDRDAGASFINDALSRTRQALDAKAPGEAARALFPLARVHGLDTAATWLAASIAAARSESRDESVQWLQPLAAQGFVEAQRALAVRGMERLDQETVRSALRYENAFEKVEIAALTALNGGDLGIVASKLDGIEELSPLRAALQSSVDAQTESDRRARALAIAGSEGQRATIRLGRLLAMRAPLPELSDAFGTLADDDRERYPALDLWLKTEAGNYATLPGAWREWISPSPPSLAARELAIGLAAERTGDVEDAKFAYGKAIYELPGEDVLRRTYAHLGGVPIAEALLEASGALSKGVRASLLRLEAIERGDLPESEIDSILRTIHDDSPELGLAAWLGEARAQKKGDDSAALSWLELRRAHSNDPMERALDAIRAAEHLPKSEKEARKALYDDALSARPEDVAVREKLELVSDGESGEHGEWCEKRAERAPGESRIVLLLQATYAYALTGRHDDAARVARLVNDESDDLIAAILHERTAMDSGEAARLAEAWMQEAKATANPSRRRELYARLAELDSERGDGSSSLLWHRTLLEENPESLPSLLSIEEGLLKEGRDDELLPTFVNIARALEKSGGPEMFAHAEVAARLSSHLDGSEVPQMVGLAGEHGHAPLWAVRAKNALAREAKNDEALRESLLTLLSRATTPADKLTLLLRLAEVCERAGLGAEAKTFLERAETDFPLDYVATLRSAEARERAKDQRGTAEALERLSEIATHRDNRLRACEKAAQLWLAIGNEPERATRLLETASTLAPENSDIADRLLSIHRVTAKHGDFVAVIERHLPHVKEEARRTSLEIDRALALSFLGDSKRARKDLRALLERDPDNLAALRALATVAETASDWEAAEQAYVRLGVLHASAEDQSLAYTRLGEIYATHLRNLPRAEVAFQEVLKRAPSDVAAISKLIAVHREQGAGPKALALQERLVAAATSPADRVAQLIALAQIYETLIGDLRKAEHAFETARKEAPFASAPLRALAEFYLRHKQMPAVHILLDRAAADARRAAQTGQLDGATFDLLADTWELRERFDAAAAVRATKFSLIGAPSTLMGAQVRAGSPEFDDYIAPDLFTPALRSLLAHAGAAMDAAIPADLKALQAIPLPKGPLLSMITSIGSMMGMPLVQAFLSPQLGMRAVPLGSFPPSIAVGEGLAAASNHPACPFVIMRAMKMIHARASALVRCAPEEAQIVALAWLSMFVRDFAPEGISLDAFREMQRKITPVIPKNLDPTLGVAALEVSGSLKENAAHIGPAAHQWANRVGLFAVGDPSVAFEGIAWVLGEKNAPTGDARAPWVARTIAARELALFTMSEGYADVRVRAGLGPTLKKG